MRVFQILVILVFTITHLSLTFTSAQPIDTRGGNNTIVRNIVGYSDNSFLNLTSSPSANESSKRMYSSQVGNERQFCYEGEKVSFYYSGGLSLAHVIPLATRGHFEYQYYFSQAECAMLARDENTGEYIYRILFQTLTDQLTVNNIFHHQLKNRNIANQFILNINENGTINSIFERTTRLEYAKYMCSFEANNFNRYFEISTHRFLTYSEKNEINGEAFWEFIDVLGRPFDARIYYPLLLSHLVGEDHSSFMLFYHYQRMEGHNDNSTIRYLRFHPLRELVPLRPNTPYLILVRWRFFSIYLLNMFTFEEDEYATLEFSLVKRMNSSTVELLLHQSDEKKNYLKFKVLDRLENETHSIQSNETLYRMTYDPNDIGKHELVSISPVNQTLSSITGNIDYNAKYMKNVDSRGNIYLFTRQTLTSGTIVKINEHNSVVWSHNIKETSPPRYKTLTLNVFEEYRTFYITDCQEVSGQEGISCYIALHSTETGQEIWKFDIIKKIQSWDDMRDAEVLWVGMEYEKDFIFILSGFERGELFTSYSLFQVMWQPKAYIIRLRRNCTCEDPKCRIPYCFGLESFDHRVCRQRGLCVESNKCECLENAYSGEMCEYKMCHGLSETDSFVCNSRGKCVDVNECKCDGWKGKSCEEYDCFGIDHRSRFACSGNGECVSLNSCKCKDTHAGKNCEIEITYPIPHQCTDTEYIEVGNLRVEREDKFLFGANAQDYLGSILTKDMDWITSSRNKIYMFSYNRKPVHTFETHINFLSIQYDDVNDKLYGISVVKHQISIFEIDIMKKRLTRGVISQINQQVFLVHDFKLFPEKNSIVVTGGFTSITRGSIKFFEGCDPILYPYNKEMSFIGVLDFQFRCKLFIPLAGTLSRTFIMSSMIDDGYIVAYRQKLRTFLFKVDKDIVWNKIYFNTLEKITTDKYGHIYMVVKYEDNHYYLDKLDSDGNEIFRVELEILHKVEKIYMDDNRNIFILEQGAERDTSCISKYHPESGEFIWKINITNAMIKDLIYIEPFLYVLAHTKGGKEIHIGSSVIYNEKQEPVFFTASLTEIVCHNCSAGYVKLKNETFGINSCAQCNAGSISKNNECVPCDHGYFSNPGSTECSPCPRGYYSNDRGSPTCYKCEIGITLFEGSTYAGCTLTLMLLIISIIGLLCLVVLGFCCFYIIKYKKAKKNERDEMERALISDATVSEKSADWHMLLDIRLDEISFKDLKNYKELKAGGSGAMIFQADWKKTKVVVKVYRLGRFESELSQYESNSDAIENDSQFAEFQRELSFMATLHHKNIVQYYGCCISPPKFGIVMEHCINGDLKHFIDGNTKILNWELKLSILLDISEGMSFLHAKSIIHRDLKPGNILIDKNCTAKISDLGVSKLIENSATNQTKIVGTRYYMAPEVIKGLNYDNKCDVFSFAIIMFEVLLCRKEHPYYYVEGSAQLNIDLKVANDPTFRPKLPPDFNSHNGSNSIAIDRLSFSPRSSAIKERIGSPSRNSKYYRMDGEEFDKDVSSINMELQKIDLIHQNVQNEYIQLMEQCWSDDPKHRPSFEEISHRLEKMLITVCRKK